MAAIANPNNIDRTNKYLLKVDDPVPGTAFIGAESHGDMSGLSVWTYLYGPDAEAVSAASKGEFQRILDTVAAGLTPPRAG